jgi:hypothetical protein
VAGLTTPDNNPDAALTGESREGGLLC